LRESERSLWHTRLSLFPTNRVSLHLPLKGYDRNGKLRDFVSENKALPVHWETLKEIGSYLAERFGGASLEFLHKQSGGFFEGGTEENWVILIDLTLDLSDINWLYARKAVWKERFDQKSIYVTVQPICVLEDDADAGEKKRED
jgi:hypothetical protein